MSISQYPDVSVRFLILVGHGAHLDSPETSLSGPTEQAKINKGGGAKKLTYRKNMENFTHAFSKERNLGDARYTTRDPSNADSTH